MTHYKEGDLLRDPTTNQPLKLFGLEKTEMVFVEKGSFIMGDGENSTEINFKNGYFIGKYPVTQELYENVMGHNPSYFKGKHRPVETVSWLDICDGKESFLAKLNNKIPKNISTLKGNFKLPSEAQWEYAACGGKRCNNPKLEYVGSQNIKDVAWYRDNTNGQTMPIGLKQPNVLGLYDMSGNVWEWCADYWSKKDTLSKDGSAILNGGSIRVLHGGGYISHAANCRLADRIINGLDSRSSNYGFRLVLSLL